MFFTILKERGVGEQADNLEVQKLQQPCFMAHRQE